MATMKDLAALLGVEIEEEFLLETPNNDSVIYKVTEEGIVFLGTGDEWYTAACNLVEGVCSGKYKLIRLGKPWKPKDGDNYWMVDLRGIGHTKFYSDVIRCYMDYICGNCFPSLEEAKAHKDEVISRITSMYQNGTLMVAEDAAKALKGYCAERECDHCKFCVDKENGEGCRLKDTPAIWPI